jgi:2-polyprenyl-6-methoxyphenol hydroxylase-like FAD-dependent oxidoreductase
VTLVGDACQAPSLLAGLGASMAMGGAYVLACELGDGADVAAALARYEARVKPLIHRQQATDRRFANWFVPPSQWRIAARDAVLRLADLPALSRLLLGPLLNSAADSLVSPAAAAPPAPSRTQLVTG